MKFRRIAIALSLLASGLFAQENRGTFSGIISDPSGSPIPKAKVTATETRTGTKTTAVSEDTGQYTIPLLLPGQYDIAVEAPGFQQEVRKGITLSAGEHPVVNVKLSIGEVTQAVTVNEDVAPLVTASPTVGQTITTSEVEDFPINGRTPMMLGNLAFGAISTYEPGPVRPFDNGAPNEISLGGAPSGTNESLLNGAPNAGFNNQMAYSPMQDSVIEVRTTAFEADASYGHTIGGTIDLITKGGTNGFHGSAYDFNQTSAFDANSFFNNANRVARPPYHQNQYGITAGGPVYVPKVFNGKNKVFWFFGWEGMRDSDPANSPLETGNPVNLATVPTPAERNGDFSALLGLGSGAATIYNPYSGTLSGTTITRTPFPNNQIPSSMINPVAQSFLQFFPQPDNPNAKPNGFQNYIVDAIDFDGYDNELGRLDFNLSDRNKLSFNVRHNYRAQNKNNYFGNVSTGNYLYRINQGTGLDDVFTISPTLFTDVRLDWSRYMEIHASPNDGFNIATLGFPASLASSVETSQLPYITFYSTSVTAGSEQSFQNLGYNGDGPNTYDAYQAFGDLVKIHGNHTIKAGIDSRKYIWSAYSAVTPAGSYTFGSSSAASNWTNATNLVAPTVPGQDFAAFLLGLPSSGSLTYNAHGTTHSFYFAGFVQDDWHARPNLTLNLGLRFEHETPSLELNNRTVDGFNPALPNSVSGPAEAAFAAALASGAYNGTPVAGIPAGSFGLGGLTFLSPSNRNIYNVNSHVFSPRIGFAWTPTKFGGKTVIRGGFAEFAAPIEVIGNGSIGSSYSALSLQQEGFSQTTNMAASGTGSTAFLTPGVMLSNPFPSGILLPTGSSLGPSTFLGQQIQYFNPSVHNPYSLRWNFGVQEQLPFKMVLEVAYIGSHSVALPISQVQLDYLPRQYESTSPVYDAATVTRLTSTVTNPMAGLQPNSSTLNAAKVSVAQLLSPFPQYPVGAGTSNGILEDFVQAGESYYNSLNVRLQKVMTNGLTLLNNFVYNNMMERMSYLNDSDPAPEKRISLDSRPLREVFFAIYQLPIGRGRAVNPQNRVVNALVGNWVVTPSITLQSGPAILWNNANGYVYFGGPLNLNTNQPNGTAFNTALFNTVSSQQLQAGDYIRTFSTMFGDLRRAPTEELDADLVKRFNVTESKYLELRIEAYNVTNHVTFGAPNITPTSTSFGEIASQANTPRRIQTGLRLVW
ncbi:MAG TPA: TonB-dependent receptor [Bryobacteraceae bacterium]|nr:TonB-dependent receptor [Bryobacteraceae bacterium]